MTHQLTNKDAKVSATPHPNGRKKAPQLNRAKSNQKDFFCDSTNAILIGKHRRECTAGKR